MNSPGMAVTAVVDAMNASALARLLGVDLMDTLRQLEGGPPSVDELRHVAKVLYGDNNPAPIQSAHLREQLIDALPLEKARELSERLGMQSGDGRIYGRLKAFEYGKDRELVLI